jgi:1-acyl-sn-glycerol-3-phosphate acyltransferase
VSVTRRDTLTRRLRSIAIVTTAFVLVTPALPLLLAAGLLFDVAAATTGRRDFAAVRLIMVGWIYLGAELLGVIALGAVWLGSAAGRIDRILIGGTYTIQRWWAGTIFASVSALLGLRFEVEGSEVLTPGPILVFMRHSSIIDNLLPNVLITAPHGIRLRYVLKRELLADPALDIAGSRLPNYFVDRGSDDREVGVEAIRRLGTGLTPQEGVLIYPEGTRFTAERRSRILARLRSSHPGLYERAASLRSVLPPRPGGAVALLGVQPAADVVIAMHRGLDGFSHVRQILNGGLVGSTIRVRFRRFAHADIPTSSAEREAWLFDRWSEVDQWVCSSPADPDSR